VKTANGENGAEVEEVREGARWKKCDKVHPSKDAS